MSAQKQRLNDIAKYLESSGGASISELSKHFGVCSKTISRDLAKLAQMGAYRSGRTWRLDKTRALDDLSSDERLVLGILGELAKGVGAEFALKARMLLERLTQNLAHPIFISTDGENLDSADLAQFETLERAIKERREIGFCFKKREFVLQPLRLAFLEGFWYVLGFDVSHLREKECGEILAKSKAKKSSKNKNNEKSAEKKSIFKKFYFKDVKNIVLKEARFSVDSTLLDRIESAQSPWFNLQKPFMVELFIPLEIAKYFKRKIPKHGRAIHDEYGNISLFVSITDEMEILPLVYKYLPFIKIISPEWLKERTVQDAKQYLAEVK